LLVSWCVGDRCDMADRDEDYGRSRRPGAEDRRMSSIGQVLGGRMPCAICTVHMKMMSAGFFIEPQNQDRWFLPVCTQN
jgi:hypothetical protein